MDVLLPNITETRLVLGWLAGGVGLLVGWLVGGVGLGWAGSDLI